MALSLALGVAFIPVVESPVLWRFTAELFPFIAASVMTLAFWIVVEKRALAINIFNSFGRDTLAGLAVGAVWVGAVVILMYASGALRFAKAQSVPWLAVWIIAVFLNAAMQELLIRGYAFSLIARRHSNLAAVIVTTVIFTALHAGAFESGVPAVINIVAAGSLFALMTLRFGSLWSAIVAHFIWNGATGILLGANVLPEDYPHVVDIVMSGNDLLTGGLAPIEGSVITAAVSVALAVIVWRFAGRSKIARVDVNEDQL
jgi:membrane protease YdiL (CAAX protease family)